MRGKVKKERKQGRQREKNQCRCWLGIKISSKNMMMRHPCSSQPMFLTLTLLIPLFFILFPLFCRIMKTFPKGASTRVTPTLGNRASNRLHAGSQLLNKLAYQSNPMDIKKLQRQVEELLDWPMSGIPPSRLILVSMNGWSCLLATPVLLVLSYS